MLSRAVQTQNYLPPGPATIEGPSDKGPSEANVQIEAIESLGLGPHLSEENKPSLLAFGCIISVSEPTAMLRRASTPNRVSDLVVPRQINPSNDRSSPRSREMGFLTKNPQAFADYIGEWVVLENETIIAHGADLAEVVAKAKKAGIKTPFAFRVQPRLAANEGNLGL